jgi:hypothetical protein
VDGEKLPADFSSSRIAGNGIFHLIRRGGSIMEPGGLGVQRRRREKDHSNEQQKYPDHKTLIADHASPPTDD